MNQIFGKWAARSFYLKFLPICWTRFNLLYPFITSPGPHPVLYTGKTSSRALNRMVIIALAPTPSLSTNGWACTHSQKEGETRILTSCLWLSTGHPWSSLSWALFPLEGVTSLGLGCPWWERPAEDESRTRAAFPHEHSLSLCPCDPLKMLLPYNPNR